MKAAIDAMSRRKWAATRRPGVSELASHLTAAAKCKPWIKLSQGPPKTFYCQETEKWLRLKAGRVVTFYQIGELYGKAYKEAATGATADNGFRASGLFPCDRNFFRPHDFPLASGNTVVAPVNHPALVKTSGQP